MVGELSKCKHLSVTIFGDFSVTKMRSANIDWPIRWLHSRFSGARLLLWVKLLAEPSQGSDQLQNYVKSDNMIFVNKVISVTEAARNFADCVNRAHYQKVTFVLLKSGSPVARIVPDEEKVCTGAELSRAAGGARLTPEEASLWGRDLRTARGQLKPIIDKWR